MSVEIAASHGVLIVAEPLNRGECNIINTVAEAMEYVQAVNHPNFNCLVDSYHLWLESAAKSEQPRVLISADSDGGSLAPDLSAALYLSEGAAWAVPRPIVRQTAPGVALDRAALEQRLLELSSTALDA